MGPRRRGAIPAAPAPAVRAFLVVRALGVSLALVAVLALGAGPLAVPARAAGAERITRFGIAYALRPDGSVHVREDITYDFGTAQGRHGLERRLELTFVAGSAVVRRYPLTGLRVSSPSGAPAAVQVTPGMTVRLRIGDPAVTVSGIQTYLIEYDLAGVVNDRPGGPELYWNATGNDWTVPVAEVEVTVTGPGRVAARRVACYQGPAGSSQPCGSSTVEAGGAARFTASGLGRAEGLTVVTAFPPGTFPGAAPVLQTLAPASSIGPAPATPTGQGTPTGLGTSAGPAPAGLPEGVLDGVPGGVPGTGPGGTAGARPGIGALLTDPAWGPAGLGTFLLLAGTATLVAARRRQDPRYRGFGKVPVVVRFTPPSGVRPGLAGTLLDESADGADVTATIVDLAVRGFLRIEEVPRTRFGRRDWRLVMLWPAPVHELEPHELVVLEAVFANRAEVTLSGLRSTFAGPTAAVRELLHEQLVARGWFTARPDRVRARWSRLGRLAFVVGFAGSGSAALQHGAALPVFLGVLVAGPVIGRSGRRMPVRTVEGLAMLDQVRGFRLYLETAEARQIQFEERLGVFGRYLPYAIAFGIAKRWSTIFGDLAASGELPGAPVGWYVMAGDGTGFDLGGLTTGISAFATTAEQSVTAPTALSSSGSGGSGGSGVSDSTGGSSGSSGFDSSSSSSGDGGGGGGGGSW